MKTDYRATEKTETHVVILGGGYAGMLAALRLAGKTKKSPCQITLVNGSNKFVERIRLHQLAANQKLRTISIPKLLQGTNVHFVQGWATQVDADSRVVKVQLADGEAELPYDKLVYALGSSIDLESIEGVAQNATALASTTMVQQMGHKISQLAQKRGRILVVGGGTTGIEAATEIAESYPELNLILATRGKLGAQLSKKGQQHLQRVFSKLGIQIKEQVDAIKVESDYLLSADGSRYPFDLCIWSAGFNVPQLAAHASIGCDDKGRVLVDEKLRSLSHPNIYAIGDSARTTLRMACATAMPMGGYVADHLAAAINGQEESSPFQFRYAVRCISLGRKDALIQRIDSQDVPQEQIFTGKIAVIIKELICRYTIWTPKLEKRLPGMYQWPQATLTMSDNSSVSKNALTNDSEKPKLGGHTHAYNS